MAKKPPKLIGKTWHAAFKILQNNLNGIIDVVMPNDGYGNCQWFKAYRINQHAWHVNYSRVFNGSSTKIMSNTEFKEELVGRLRFYGH
jgi:hypothetical protein